MPNLLHRKNHNDNDNTGMNGVHHPVNGVGQPNFHQGYDSTNPNTGYDTTVGGQGVHPGTGVGMHHQNQNPNPNPNYPTSDIQDSNVNGIAPGGGAHGTGGILHHNNNNGQFPPSDIQPANQAHTSLFSKPHPGNPTVPGTTHNTHSNTVPHTGTVGPTDTTGPTGPTQPTHSSQIQTSTGKSPSSQARTGKIEHLTGTILHSSTIKAKGTAKIAEADAVNSQREELRRAEVLESNARLARERAEVHQRRGVVHGSVGGIVEQHGVGGMGAGQPLR